MHKSPFVRVAATVANALHVAKENYPNEALCGRSLRPESVTPKGRKKCSHCSAIMSKKTEKES